MIEIPPRGLRARVAGAGHRLCPCRLVVVGTGRYNVAVGLEDLPEHRHDYLLWKHAHWLDYDGVADMIAEMTAASNSCVRSGSAEREPDLVAELGDDGRYHLRVDGRVVCADVRRRGDPGNVVRHIRRCSWNLDTDSKALPDNKISAGGLTLKRGENLVRWLVQFTGTSSAPELVRFRQRCQPYYDWPPVHTVDTPLGRVRAALITAFGRQCQTCGASGRVVDHDHFTGMVRGWLCGHCNTHVDDCPHPSDCPWAEYLNSPPAAGLQLYYPKADGVRNKPSTLARIEFLGFDPFTRRGPTYRTEGPAAQPGAW